MSEVFRGLAWKLVHVFDDDILMYCNTFEQHLSHLQWMFNRLRDANLKLKTPKCVFATTEVSYLGYIISRSNSSPG